MAFQKLIHLFIVCLVFQLVACSTAPIRFDPNTVLAADKIGVWSTYSPPKASRNSVIETVLDLKLHKFVEERFIEKAPLVVNAKAKYQTIDYKEIVIGSDNRPDLLATAKSLGLDKVIIINTAATVSEIILKTHEYNLVWRPELEISGKMLNVSDGKVLWSRSIKAADSKNSKLGAIGLDLANLAVNTADRLVADINRLGKEDASIQISAGKGDLKKVKAEIDGGKDVNAKDLAGQTALMWASESGSLEVVKYLIERGADINSQSLYGGTALISASGFNRTVVMEYLLENGADIDLATYSTETALFWAIEKGHVEAVILLLRNNATTKIKNKKGKTALDVAKELNRKQIEILILEATKKKVEESRSE